MPIKFGPSGIGSIREIKKTFEEYNKQKIKAAEIAFTYGIYIKKIEDAKMIRKFSKKFDISLTIHAPYWINLNSSELEKIKASKKRILDSCRIANWVGAKKVVFHCGYFGKDSKRKTYENIRNRINEIQKDIKQNKWNVKLAPEVMGKINVFGSIEEISHLVKDTQCSFCLDFAHIIARDKRIDWCRLKKLFPQKNWHCHFSGIDYNEKGEKNHKITEKKFWKNLLIHLPKSKKITIINESPTPIRDSVLGINLNKSLRNFH